MGIRKRLALAVILLCICVMVSAAASAATIRGSIYDHSYDAIRKAVIQINSSPEQTKVAAYGGYYFVVPPGSYELSATLTLNGITREIAREYITITNDGDYMKDMLMFDDFDMNAEFDDSNISKLRRFVSDNMASLLSLLFIVFIVTVVVTILRIWHKRYLKKIESSTPIMTVHEVDASEHVQTVLNTEIVAESTPIPQQAAPQAPETSHTDLKSVDDVLISRIITVLTKAGGELSQKDIRKEFNVSEAKISMIVSDMETKGLVVKTKKGRTNVVKLVVKK